MRNIWRKIKRWFKRDEPTGVVMRPRPEPETEQPRKLERKNVLIDFAVQSTVRMPVRGPYSDGWPKGLVVHFTAGRRGGIRKALDSVKSGSEKGFTYLVIGDDGSLVQGHPVEQWGYHAGESKWPGLKSSVHKDLIGVEINCAGKLERIAPGKLQTWFGTPVPIENARRVEESEWGCPTGYYEKFTDKQEETLMRLILWLKRNDPTGKTFSFDFVLGHHEVSGKRGIGRWRKNDPGGSLSMSMDKFRERLKQQWEMDSRV